MDKNVKKLERRVINLDKNDYQAIKKYCNENALCLPKWMTKLALNEISKQSK